MSTQVRHQVVSSGSLCKLVRRDTQGSEYQRARSKHLGPSDWPTWEKACRGGDVKAAQRMAETQGPAGNTRQLEAACYSSRFSHSVHLARN